MLDDQRPGAIYWIDHYVVGTDDIDRWTDFHEKVLGARSQPTAEDRRRQVGVFQDLTSPCHHGGFVQREALPPSAGLGSGLPRHGLFIRPEDIEEHLRRLDRYQVPHTDPARTSAEGEEGTSILWEDPDGNQFEFWAPAHMPEGAMDGCGPLKVGRISHGVYESRDLQRTADFFDHYCALTPASSADIPSDTLVLPLAGGGRIVYKRVEPIGKRTSGWGKLNALHAALVVRDEDFFPNYQRMWAELPDWEVDAETGRFVGGGESLPARTALHGSPAGRKFYEVYGRGDDWYDWDTNQFHFFGGKAIGGSMAQYEPHSMEFHIKEYMEAHGQGPLGGARPA